MTDVSAQQQQAPIEPSAADLWQADWNAFMGHGFGDVPNGEEPEPAPEGDNPPLAAVPAQQDPPAAPANGEPAPAKTDATGETGTPAGEEKPPEGGEISPEMLLAMATGGQQPQQQQGAPAQPAAEAPKPQGEPELFRPFDAPIGLPQQTLAALFEAEDTGTRAAAIGSVLQSMGNAIVQIAEKRIQEHYMPMIRQQVLTEFDQQSSVRQAQADFYGAYPYLNREEYKPVVGKAFQIIAEKHPTLSFEEAKSKVGDLARAFIKQTTGKDPAPASAPADPPAQQQQQQQKPPGFVASGARPAGTGSPPDPSSPSAVLEDLLQF